MSTQEEKKVSGQPLTFDLHAIVEQCMLDINQSNFVYETVNTRLRSTIKEIINDLFREYGSFGKQLKEMVEKKLQINFDKLDLSSYNQLLLDQVKSMIDQDITQVGVAKFAKQLDDMMNSAEPEYKLSEIVKEMREYAQSHNEHDDASECAMIIDRDFSLITYIYLDPRGEQRNKYHYRYTICVNAKTGEVTRVSMDDKTFDSKKVMAGLYGFDEKLFKMFARGSVIVIDEDDVDLEYEYNGD